MHELLWLAVRPPEIIANVARGTGDPDHDWTTCAEPSCVMARAALSEEVKEGTNG